MLEMKVPVLMIAKTIRTCFPIAVSAVADKAEEINKLNVFPVPDGDTGTNMSLTLQSVVKELAALPVDADMDAIAGAITHGSLMGARGNSGVITSQILRGVAEGLRDAGEPVDASDVAAAFRRAVKVAFQAVRKPIEGTILTVLRDVSTRADECEKKRLTVEETLDALVVEAYQSVARTPDLLPVLKENGVVDSGAFGFAIFLENFVAAALGRTSKIEDFSATFDADATSAKAGALDRVKIEANDDWEGSEFRYCNEFLFKAERPFDEDEVLKFLGSMGDCELLVGAYPDYKVHVHSNTPNLVLEHMLQFGQVYEVFIHNMDLEVAERTAKIHADQDAAVEPAKALGFVAVAAGSGEAEILKSLGVDVVVSGGQTMNPSTESILEGVNKIPAETVFVLPNNGNIIMAAQQCAALTEKQVVVIPTKTVPQGITAMMNVDFDAPDAQTITDAMTGSLSSVTTAQITYAARDSDFDGFAIKEGDYLALEEGKLFDTDDSLDTLLHKLAEDAAGREASFISLYFGEDVQEADAQKAGALFEEVCPGAEVAVLSGGQPVYYYIISME